MKIDDYRNHVKEETKRLCARPPDTIRNWAAAWKDCFRLLLEGRVEPNGLHIGRSIFEPCALIIARWEFLGSLFVGHDKKRSGRSQAMAYATRFLVRINNRYEKHHPTIARDWNIARLLFQILRNGSLHGFTPSGVYDATSDSCIGWALAPKLDDPGQHLHFDSIDNLCVDVGVLLDELIESMHCFATYLDDNKRTTKKTLPTDDFREGFRWRLMPWHDEAAPPSWIF